MGNKLRIILDTNWYISAAINKKSRRTLFEILTNQNFTVIYCDELVIEFQSVIDREKFKKIISPKQAIRFMDLVIPKLENINLKTSAELSRDPNDNYLLSLSIDGVADYLITGDLDLLVLESVGKTKILKLNQFTEIVGIS